LQTAICGLAKGHFRRPEDHFTAACAVHIPAPMIDLLLVVSAIAFFGLAWAYVHFCGLGGSP
jgi:hypothetical protein